MLVTPGTEIMTSFQNAFILKRAGVANFADIIKIAIMLIKTTFKNSKELVKNFKRARKKCIKTKLLFVFPEITKTANFW